MYDWDEPSIIHPPPPLPSRISPLETPLQPLFISFQSIPLAVELHWAAAPDKCSGSRFAAIDLILLAGMAMLQGMQPSQGERARRLDTLELLGGVVERGIAYENNLQARPYGSFVSNVYSPGGDLDVSIEGYVMR